MSTVNLSAEDLIGLLRASKERGTQNKALDLAIEWIEAAELEILRLKAPE